jgi:hypothetical protein
MKFAKVVCLAGHEETNDQAEETKDGAEDLDDQDLDKSGEKILARASWRCHDTTHSVGSAASANAAPLPLIPTATPHTKLQPPTVTPAQNNANPV